jgi:putative ABC transport system permease protein
VVVTEVMNFQFTWLPGPALLSACAALMLTLALGLVGTVSALGQKPAPVLRNL